MRIAVPFSRGKMLKLMLILTNHATLCRKSKWISFDSQLPITLQDIHVHMYDDVHPPKPVHPYVALNKSAGVSALQRSVRLHHTACVSICMCKQLYCYWFGVISCFSLSFGHLQPFSFFQRKTRPLSFS